MGAMKLGASGFRKAFIIGLLLLGGSASAGSLYVLNHQSAYIAEYTVGSNSLTYSGEIGVPWQGWGMVEFYDERSGV